MSGAPDPDQLSLRIMRFWEATIDRVASESCDDGLVTLSDVKKLEEIPVHVLSRLGFWTLASVVRVDSDDEDYEAYNITYQLR